MAASSGPDPVDGAVSPLDRRSFLKVGAAFGGGLVLALALPLAPSFARGAPDESAVFSPNAFIRIDPAGVITMVMPMAEMGQGVYTALAMLLAEELEVGLDQVKLEAAPPNDALYANSILHAQTTGLSSSIRAFWTPLRQAGAVARMLLVSAAARQWGVDPGTCRARHGVVSDAASARRLTYGQLANAAASLPVPRSESVALKQPKDFTLIGKPAKRLDSPEKVNGRVEYGIDVKLPGLKVAAVSISPVFGGKVKSLDEAAARGIHGVRQVVRLDEAVAVVADHMWAALKALRSAAVAWDPGPNATISSADIIRQLEEGSKQPGAVARNEGDAPKALAEAARRIDAIYQLPFLAHAAMEPMNCTAHVRKDGCDIWVGTQAPTLTQTLVAQAVGLPKDAVRVHNCQIGGGFGRRLEVDGSVLAARVARQVDGPVKVIWSREEDIQHDMYRPCYYDRVSVGLDVQGKPVAWTHRVAGSSVVARYVPPLFRNGLDFDAVEGAAELLYPVTQHSRRLRASGTSRNPDRLLARRGTGEEHLHRRNADRRVGGRHETGSRGVSQVVAERKSACPRRAQSRGGEGRLGQTSAGASRPRPRGSSIAFGSFLAQVAEVEVAQDGTIKVHRLVCAVDCGVAVNPDTIAAQVEGGSIVRTDGGAVRRDHDEGRARRAEQLPRLSAAADARSPDDRDAHHPQHRVSRRFRRGADIHRYAGRRQCDFCRDRQTHSLVCRSTPGC